MSQTMTLHSHLGPNPWKIALVLTELSLPYTNKIWATEDLKHAPFTTELNPNGFTPVLSDPNTGLTIWESGAIVDYLLEVYDKSHKLHFEGLKDRTEMRQWLYFQQTFQGPNLSLARRFILTTPVDVARERFVGECLRVCEVLEGALQGKEWLVGGRCSVADLMFIPHHLGLAINLGAEMPKDMKERYPNVEAWMERMTAMQSVKKVLGEKGRETAAFLKR